MTRSYARTRNTNKRHVNSRRQISAVSSRESSSIHFGIDIRLRCHHFVGLFKSLHIHVIIIMLRNNIFFFTPSLIFISVAVLTSTYEQMLYGQTVVLIFPQTITLWETVPNPTLYLKKEFPCWRENEMPHA